MSVLTFVNTLPALATLEVETKYMGRLAEQYMVAVRPRLMSLPLPVRGNFCWAAQCSPFFGLALAVKAEQSNDPLGHSGF